MKQLHQFVIGVAFVAMQIIPLPASSSAHIDAMDGITSPAPAVPAARISTLQASSTSAALTYLTVSQSSSGAWTSDKPNLAERDTASAIVALRGLTPTFSSLSHSMSWIVGQDIASTDYLARRMLALAGTGYSITTDRDTLLSRMAETGAWSGSDIGGPGGGDTFDTGLVLTALAASGDVSHTQSVSYLVSQQHPDGGWSVANTPTSTVQGTTAVLMALGDYRNLLNLQSPISIALAFLHTRINGDGGFGENGASNARDSALGILALRAVDPAGQVTAILGAQTWLSTHQLPNGSWDSDVYATALAVQALGAPATAITPGNGRVIGRAFDEFSHPVISGTVAVAGATTTVDASGGFTLTSVPAGPELFQFAGGLPNTQSYSSGSAGGIVPAGGVLDLGSVILIAPRPVVSFTWTPAQPIEGGGPVSGLSPLTFINQTVPVSGTSIINIQWTASDGTSNNSQPPSYIQYSWGGKQFAEAGVYTITLNVEDSRYIWTSLSLTVPITDLPPVVVPGPTVTTVANAPLHFYNQFDYPYDRYTYAYDYGANDNATLYTTARWDFGDGHGYRWGDTEYMYHIPGVYSATFSVTDRGGQTTSGIRVITILPNTAPTLTTIIAPPTATVYSTVNFNSDAVSSDDQYCPTSPLCQYTPQSNGLRFWRWDFGDGTSTVLKNPPHFYDSSGNYTVTLTVTNTGGLTATVSRPITILGALPVIALSPVITIQPGLTQTFNRVVSATSPAFAAALTTNWNFGDGITSSLLAPFHTWSAPGLYTMTVTAQDPTAAKTLVTTTVLVTSTAPLARIKPYSTPDGFDIGHGGSVLFSACYAQWDPVTCVGTYPHLRWYVDGVLLQDDTSANGYGYYTLPGSYTTGLHVIMLVATAQDGGTAIDARIFRVIAAVGGGSGAGPTSPAHPRGVSLGNPFGGYGYYNSNSLIDWGDGWTNQPADYPPAHTYASSGIFTRTFYSVSADGVVNAPSINVITITEPMSPLLTLKSATVPCRVQLDSCDLATTAVYSDDTVAYTSIWQDGLGHSLGPRSGDLFVNYPATGVYTPSVVIYIPDGVTATAWTTVTVVDVPPTVTLPLTQVVLLGDTVTLFGLARHISPIEDQYLSLGMDFGDGSPSIAPARAVNGTIAPTHTYTSAGVYIATLTAIDRPGAVVSTTSRISVLAYRRPIISSSAPPIAAVAIPYHYSVIATDPLSYPLSFFLSQRPDGMVIDASGNISWTPGLSQTGFVQVTVVVSNSAGATTLQVFPITVLAQALAPDLAPVKVSAAGLTSNPQSLSASGAVSVVVTNFGILSVTHPFSVTFFDDTNEDGAWSPGVDTVLALATQTLPIASGQSVTLTANVTAARVLFRDNIVYAYVDSGNKIDEGTTGEANNIASSAAGARFIPPPGIGAPALKMSWTGSTVRRRCCYIQGDTMGAVLGSPIVAPLIDTNSDGRIDDKDVPAIIFTSFVNSIPYGSGAGGMVIRAIRGDNSKSIFDAIDDVNQVVVPACTFYICMAQVTPVVGDIDGDGKREVIYIGSDGGNSIYARALNSDGSLHWTSDLVPTKPQHSYEGLPTIADIDGDGKSEIVFGDIVWNHDGHLRWAGSGSGRYGGEGKVWSGGISGIVDVCCHSVVADLAMDGHLKIIAGNRAYNADGSIYWDAGLTPTLAGDGFAAVARFNLADPYPDVALVTHVNQHGYGPYSIFGFDAQVRVLTHDGHLLWGPITVTAPSWANVAGAPSGGGPPVIADLNGDGIPDIGMDGFFAYTAINGKDGSYLWQVPIHDHSSGFTGSSAFDFDGSGKYDIVDSDELYLRILRGSDGATLWQTPNPNSTALEEPAIADVDGSGHVSTVVGRNQYKGDESAIEFPGKAGGFDVGVFDQGIFVFSDALNYWRPGRSVWNQSAYQVTNVNDDGTIPAHPLNSWQTPGGANTWRAQLTPPGLDPFAAPDLTASRMVVDNATCPVSATVTIRAGNGGSMHVLAGVKVTFRTDGALIGVISTTQTLQPGQYQDVSFRWSNAPSGSHTISATIDDDGAGLGVIPESREDNNTHTRTVPVCSGVSQPPQINSTPVLTVLVNTLYSYPVNAIDPNSLPLSYNIGNSPAGAVMGSDGIVLWRPTPAQLGLQNITVVVDNGSGGVTRQTFAVTVISQQPLPAPVQLCTIPGAPGIPGNGIGQDCIPATSIIVNTGAVTPTIATDKRSYTANDLARLLTSVRNASLTDTYVGLSATVTVKNAGNNVVYSAVHTPSTLGPKGAVALADTFDTGSQPPGTYAAQVVVTFGNTVIASASASFTVTDAVSQLVALSGVLTATPQVVSPTLPYTVAWSATNAGNTTLGSIVLQLLAVNPTSGAILSSRALTAPLAVGQTVTSSSVFTSTTQQGPILLVLLGTTQGVTDTLASGGVAVGSPNLSGARVYLPMVLR